MKYYGGFPPGPLGPDCQSLPGRAARRGRPDGRLRLRSPSDIKKLLRPAARPHPPSFFVGPPGVRRKKIPVGHTKDISSTLLQRKYN